MCKSKWIQYQVQGHFLHKAVPDPIPLLPYALPTSEHDASLWNPQWFTDGSCLTLSYILISCLPPLPKLDFLQGADHGLWWVPMSEKEIQWLCSHFSFYFLNFIFQLQFTFNIILYWFQVCHFFLYIYTSAFTSPISFLFFFHRPRDSVTFHGPFVPCCSYFQLGCSKTVAI